MTTASGALRKGRLRPEDLVDQCLGRIEECEPDLHAWVVVDTEGARQAARRLSDEAAAGNWRGPLHGIPMGIKDIIDVAGLPTRAGSPLRDQHVAEEDAPVVAELRRAGAIILGKTVTTQFACFDPAATTNPWDADRTPGGSSSGSAVAVASGMCPAALGSQTGGSIIRPATYCGVAGFKPTRDAWSTTGVVPVSFHLDHIGPLAPTVADLHLIWQSLGYGQYTTIGTDDVKLQLPGAIRTPQSFFWDRYDPLMSPVLNSAAARLVIAGADIRDVPLPGTFGQVHEMHRRIMAVELAEYHRHEFSQCPEAFAGGVAGLIEEGLRTSSVDYAEALKHRLNFIADMRQCLADDHAVLITPATTSAAPPRATTGDPAFNSPWSYCGFPAVSFPCGRTDDGLPVGLQLIGLPGTDDQLLKVGMWCEAVLSGNSEADAVE